jgi:hypothetical protein
MLKHGPTAVDRQHIVHIRQPIVRHDDAHPAALGPPASSGANSAAPERRASFGSASSATVPALDFKGLVRPVMCTRARHVYSTRSVSL